MRSKRKSRFIICLLIIFVVLIFISIFNSSYIKQVSMSLNQSDLGEAIDLETGIINNDYFKINKNGDMPEETTNGINYAIEYARDNNISNIKLEKGIYTVIGYNNSHYRGLVMQSNINLDLNGSTIIQNPNNQYAYANVTMYNIENASISNGILVGDKDQHNYNQENGETHEGGYGISIIACNNVTVNNLEIYNMTGDGINIYGINKGEKICNNVKVENNNIYNCRRQGITIGCGENILIRNNEVHDISGTSPQSAIDLEGVFQSEIIDKVIIENNKIYNLGNVNALLLVGYIENVEVNSNQLEKNILIYDAKQTIIMKNNEIKNGIVDFSNNYTNMNVGHNINYVLFKNNKLVNSSLRLSKVMDGNVFNNNIQNGKIEFISSNGNVKRNRLNNFAEIIEVAIDFSNISGHTEKYEVEVEDNQIDGNYGQKIAVDYDYYTVN